MKAGLVPAGTSSQDIFVAVAHALPHPGVFGLILALTTRLNDYRKAIAEDTWQRSDQFFLLDFPLVADFQCPFVQQRANGAQAFEIRNR